MKKHLHIFGIALLGLAILFTTSCKKEEKEETTPTPPAKTSSTVLKDENARSERIVGSFTTTSPDGNTVTMSNANSATIAGYSAVAKDRHDVLVAGKNPSKASAGTFGWSLDEYDGQVVTSDHMVFFDDNGSYIFYDFDTDEWDWGFYYIDQNLDYIVFDHGTQWEWWWAIDSLVEVDQVTGEHDCYFHDEDGKSGIFASYLLDGYEEPEPYTQADVKNILNGKVLINNYTYEYDNFDIFETDLADVCDQTAFDTITFMMFAFQADSFAYAEQDFDGYTGDSLSAMYMAMGTYTVNTANETITFSYVDEMQQQQTLTLTIDYIEPDGSGFGLSDEDVANNYFGMWEFMEATEFYADPDYSCF